jgi:hypothetical protein
MGKKMSNAEMAEFQQRCRERWARVLDALSWSRGPMDVWKPEMTEQQKKEFDEYRIKHSTPF